jgi:hypothetical protein
MSCAKDCLQCNNSFWDATPRHMTRCKIPGAFPPGTSIPPQGLSPIGVNPNSFFRCSGQLIEDAELSLAIKGENR